MFMNAARSYVTSERKSVLFYGVVLVFYDRFSCVVLIFTFKIAKSEYVK